MATRDSRFVSRRTILAAAPVGVLAEAAARVTLAQPAAADPVSFYLGQVLALATLQAQAVGRLQPLLASPNAEDGTWQAAAAAEAGVIGAVASVLGGMEPPPDLTASVGELRLASAAYGGAADAAWNVASGDATALDAAGTALAEGAAHILLWLDALTAETDNDWGDGLRTLTEASGPVPVMDEAQLATLAGTPAEPSPEESVAEPAADEPAEDDQADRQAGNRQNRKTEQNDDVRQPNRQNRANRANREGRAADE